MTEWKTSRLIREDKDVGIARLIRIVDEVEAERKIAKERDNTKIYADKLFDRCKYKKPECKFETCEWCEVGE